MIDYLRKFRIAYARLRGRIEHREVDPLSFSYTEEEWEENRRCVEAAASFGSEQPLRTINWFLIPTLGQPMGGMSTIYRFATYFAKEKGVTNTFVYCGKPSFSEEDVRRSLGAIIAEANVAQIRIGTDTPESLGAIPPCDAAFATRWDTAYPLMRFSKTRMKYYLVQDFEPAFYPAGITHEIAQHTYTFGFKGVMNSPALKEVYDAAGNYSMYFIPTIDRERYALADPASRPEGRVRLFFYARPGKPRNGFEFGLAVISALKAEYGNRIEIVTAGQDWDPRLYGAEDIVTDLGLIADLGEVAAIYQSCAIGMFFVYSKGFPLSAIEYLSTGGALLTNRNPANAHLFQDGETAMTSGPSVEEAVTKLRMLIDDRSLRETLAKKALGMLAMLEQERARGHDEEAIGAWVARYTGKG